MPQKQANFTIMGGRVRMVRGAYAPTSDAVWLAAGAGDIRNIKSVLDVGVGTGAATLCLMQHLPDITACGIDISDDMLATCATNATLNNRALELINADIATWRTTRTFDLVISNPPYFKGTPAAHNAHHNTDLAMWTRKCLARVRPRGYICMISDAGSTAELVAAMMPRCGDITLFPLFGAGNVAERVIIRARMGVRGPSVIKSALSMNDDAILRDGLTIDASLATLNP